MSAPETEAGLSIERALAWFGEPRYSVTDLQRAWAEGAAEAIARTYESVLRGLRSEDDTPQLRAIIASVEADAARVKS